MADISGLERSTIELAASYYAAYPDEIEERIQIADQAADRLRRALGAAYAA